MKEKSSRDQANRRQELGLVWRNRKKISQNIKDYILAVLPLNYFMGGGNGANQREGLRGNSSQS
jgi:hypothetical protein